MIPRKDDFEVKAKRFEKMSDEELEKYFWDLTEKIVDPLIDLAYRNTSPSIERSVLLRMGFSSLQAKALVDKIFEKGLLGKGAGNIVYRVSKDQNISIEQAGSELIQGRLWDVVQRIFEGGNKA